MHISTNNVKEQLIGAFSCELSSYVVLGKFREHKRSKSWEWTLTLLSFALQISRVHHNPKLYNRTYDKNVSFSSKRALTKYKLQDLFFRGLFYEGLRIFRYNVATLVIVPLKVFDSAAVLTKESEVNRDLKIRRFRVRVRIGWVLGLHGKFNQT